MWRESIGTAIGVVHASREGLPVVVADPNHLGNKTLDFYADVVTETPRGAAEVLLNLLRAEEGWSVQRPPEGSKELFERRKLADSIRAACRSTGRDGIIVSKLVLPRVIGLLAQQKKNAIHYERDR